MTFRPRFFVWRAMFFPSSPLGKGVCFLLLLIFFSIQSGCSPSWMGKKKPEERPVAVEDPGLTEATQKIIARLNNTEFLSGRKDQPCEICFLGVQNDAGEAIPELGEAVRRQFREKAPNYSLLDDVLLEDALKKSDVKRNNVYIPAEREKLTKTLNRPFRYILSARVVSLGATKTDLPMTGDILHFELVSLDDNHTERVQKELTAFYNEKTRKKVFGIF